MVHEAFWFSTNPDCKHVLAVPLYGTTEYADAPVPLIDGLLNVSPVGPTFFTVTDNCFVFGFTTVPKLKLVLDNFTAVPRPFTGKLTDVTPAGSPLNDAVTVLVVVPLTVGVNTTLK